MNHHTLFFKTAFNFFKINTPYIHNVAAGLKNYITILNPLKNHNIYTNLGSLALIGLKTKKTNHEDKSDFKQKDPKEEAWAVEKDIDKFISSAEIAIKDGNLKKAQLILHEALNLHESRNPTGVSSIYDMLATVAYKEGNVEKSKEILEKVIDYLTKSGIPPDHEKVVSFRLKLARLLSKLGRVNEAEGHFRQCLEIQKLKHQIGLKDEENDKLRINCLFWYGRHLVGNKQFPEAKQCFETAYTLTARNQSIDNNQVMVILYNLSDTMLATGDQDGARHSLLSAILIGKTNNSSDVPLYCAKLGTLYLLKGMTQEARHWCQYGIDSAKKLKTKAGQEEGEKCIEKINEVFKLGQLKI